jgi:meso-butanediol dehydrogenase/(S,S)-butanediol dehydrogenase/diacetyl reductase
MSGRVSGKAIVDIRHRRRGGRAFAPGAVDTPLWTTLDAHLMAIGDAEQPGQATSGFAADILRGRPATPDDVVGTALHLDSSDSDHLTGQIIMIDGGMVVV